MKYGQVAGIDKPISRFVLGAMLIRSDDDFALLDKALANDCNAIDTAQVYGHGESERALGRWISSRHNRENLVLITKGAHPNLDRRRVTPFDISSDLYDSLARLKTDYIDLYLLHRDEPAVPVGPILDVLNEHLQAGRIRALGASNWTHTRLQEANDYAAVHGLAPFVASSPQYSLADQIKTPWEGCLTISGPSQLPARQWYLANQMPIFAWSSLAGGFLSGRFNRHNLDVAVSELDKRSIESYGSEDNFKRLDRAAQLAQEKGLTVAQIALAYIVNQPLNMYAVVGCANSDIFTENLVGFNVTLSPDELRWLNLEQAHY